ncbi:hypothetical protein GCM10011368_11630 [Hyunsoonleella pacifica]|nr:hypothetical protein GCM10011368_11630 [Hyunsoonleella pacifica]
MQNSKAVNVIIDFFIIIRFNVKAKRIYKNNPVVVRILMDIKKSYFSITPS